MLILRLLNVEYCRKKLNNVHEINVYNTVALLFHNKNNQNKLLDICSFQYIVESEKFQMKFNSYQSTQSLVQSLFSSAYRVDRYLGSMKSHRRKKELLFWCATILESTITNESLVYLVSPRFAMVGPYCSAL